MDALNAVVTVLGNGYFPIAVCGCMFWYVYKKDLQHREEIAELRKSVDNNTLVVQKLVDRMDGDEK